MNATSDNAALLLPGREGKRAFLVFCPTGLIDDVFIPNVASDRLDFCIYFPPGRPNVNKKKDRPGQGERLCHQVRRGPDSSGFISVLQLPCLYHKGYRKHHGPSGEITVISLYDFIVGFLNHSFDNKPGFSLALKFKSSGSAAG